MIRAWILGSICSKENLILIERQKGTSDKFRFHQAPTPPSLLLRTVFFLVGTIFTQKVHESQNGPAHHRPPHLETAAHKN